MAAPESPTELAQWLLDTRSWYPEATTTKSLETHASRALALVPAAERAGVLRYFRVADAKMSLASHLLKHYCVARLAAVPWSLTAITRAGDPKHGKPVWVPQPPSLPSSPVSFNVTHQAGIVALIAVAAYPPPGSASAPDATVQVGVDVVCTSERRERDRTVILQEGSDGDHDRVRGAKTGWERFVDMHSEVFAPSEVARLKDWQADPGQNDPGGLDATDAKLRAFYALWAMREAFIKLTGEALMAPWLRELEFRAFAPPRPTSAWGVPAREGGGFGEAAPVREVFLRGERVEDVNVSLRSIGPDYMVATAVRAPWKEGDALDWRLGPYDELGLDDVLDFAEAHP